MRLCVEQRVLVIDNYDSFTYNVVQALAALGARVIVHRNDALRVEDALRLAPTHLVVSPGPGRPEDAGISVDAIRAFMGRVPVLGVCLGHQALAVAIGGTVRAAARLMHGKISWVHHDERTLYQDMPNPFGAGRYHSLALASESMPAELSVSARADDGEIMGIRHRSLPVEGVQFHPESVLTPLGDQLFRNFLRMTPR
jgi:anthranilate synthase component 2/para-aminobenzoate synthetase component 2